MWKKQIHTEAEMLAQAETTGENGDHVDADIVKGKEAELVAMIDGEAKESGEARKASSQPTKSRSISRSPSPAHPGDFAAAGKPDQTGPAVKGPALAPAAGSGGPERTPQETTQTVSETNQAERHELDDREAIADEHGPAITSEEIAGEVTPCAQDAAVTKGGQSEDAAKPADSGAARHEPRPMPRRYWSTFTAKSRNTFLERKQQKVRPRTLPVLRRQKPRTRTDCLRSTGYARGNTPAERSSIGPTSSPSSRPDSMCIPSFRAWRAPLPAVKPVRLAVR